jgi:WD40 repeat protein
MALGVGTDREETLRIVKSAFDSSTFDATVTIHVQKDATDIGSASISPSGRDVAIASKTGLDIIDLDSPLNPPRHLRHGVPWNVADVQWSPFAARDYWVVSTANQKVLVWNLVMQEDSRHGAIEHSLHGHTRAVTDINFSAHNPDILSTCAVDGYVHCWDLRRPRRPVMTFVDWDAGATQVKWNRQDEHILASSHDRWLRIWDYRHGAYPLRSINAHESKIYGVDWNRTRRQGIVTCSLDKSIKFWDYTNPEDIPERVIRTAFPVWRARHTPFGWGLLAMPQTAPGNLHLYDRRKDTPSGSSNDPVAVFNHGDAQVKEFLWRSRGKVGEDGIDNRDFQLVSWGTDKELKLQRIPNTILENVGYVKGTRMKRRLNITRKGATYKTFRNVDRPDLDKKTATIQRPRHLSTSHEKDVAFSVVSEGFKKMSPAKRFKGYMGVGRTTMKGRIPEQETRSQINWMTGVKFSSNNIGGDGTTLSKPPRRLSVISPNFDMESDWDTPEPLHDEIIRVHHQYSKVTFNDVNIDKRTIQISMNGPWGKGQDSVFAKATITFPDHYPGGETPKIVVGKSSNINDEVYKKITSELGQIATGFVKRKRGCLEPIICYLLGEVDLEESLSWLTTGQEAIDHLLAHGIESSSSESEEDDDLPPGSSAMMSQELDPNEGTLAAIRRQANVLMPIPRLCGARFSPNGKLVCFFPPKEEKFKSLLGDAVLGKGRQSGEPSFNTFSRLTTETIPRGKFASLAEEDDDESGSASGSESETSSSSDSDSSQFQVSVAFDFWRKIHGSSYKKGISTNRSNRSSGGGTGTMTGTGTGASKGRPVKPKNILLLEDVTEFIPSKTELAMEYAIFGEGADVCNHNALVARKHGYQERSDIWTYASLLLQHEVPLEVLDQSMRSAPILVIARDMIRHCRAEKSRDSGVDFSYDTGFSGRVKWGYSPLAKQLIAELFSYFEQTADIQMLAMLSCVFTEPNTPAIEPVMPRLEGRRLSQPRTPMSLKTPAFSLDYFPTDLAAWSAYQKTPYSSIPSTPRTATTPAITPMGAYGSLGSDGPWGINPHKPTTPSLEGTTPPFRSRGGSSDKLAQAIYQGSQSLSTSPEDSRTFHRRSNTGLAATFAANIKSQFVNVGGSGMSASPPGGPGVGQGKKRPSPVESAISAISTLAPSSVTWGHNTYLESVRERAGVGYPKSTASDTESIAEDESKAALPVSGISVTLHNVNAFDDEGALSTTLLSRELADKGLFSAYRRLYADILAAWQLPINRLEILKFDSLLDYQGHDQAEDDYAVTDTPARSPAALKTPDTEHPHGILEIIPPTQTSNAVVEERGLAITGYCLKHDRRLDPLPAPSRPDSKLVFQRGSAAGRCDRCKAVKTQLLCIVCLEPITASYSACLSCGCASHTTCLEAYFGSFEEGTCGLNGTATGSKLSQSASGRLGGNGEYDYVLGDACDLPTCPGGCDCPCLSRAGKGIVESWEVMMGALEMMRRREREREHKEKERRERRRLAGVNLSPRVGSGKGTPKQSESDADAGGGSSAGRPGSKSKDARDEKETRSPSVAQAGYGTLSRRLGQVRSADWSGVGAGLRKKASSLRGD